MVSRLARGDRPRVSVSESTSPPAAIRLVRVRVPLLGAHTAAHGLESVRDVVLIGWTRADGVHGWGECPTLSTAGYATETTEQAWAGLVDRLAPAVLAGRGVIAAGLVAATSALRDAELDADLRSVGRSLVDELGGPADPLERCVVLADLGASPSSLATRAQAAMEAGASMVKVKIAPGHDVDVLRAVAEAIGSTVVAADANGSYSLDGAGPGALAALDELGLVYLEQPVPAGETWDALAQLCVAMTTPIALDESLVSLDAVRSAVLAGAADIVSVKPARLGGVRAGAAAIEMARERGVPVFVGGMLELGIGRATATALASFATAGAGSLPTDLGPSGAYVDTDVCEPVVVDPDGRLVVPHGPGIGREPDESVLSKYLVEDVTLTG